MQAVMTLALGACAVSRALAQGGASQPLQALLAQGDTNPLYAYPTQLTQGIVPKNFHSHNDYWRPLPFLSALAAGAMSVEADVWLYNGTLHVGHETSALTAERTFDALYVRPILDVLRRQNPASPFVAGPTYHGVYDTSADQTLYLFVDVKTGGHETWPYVVEALAPLRDAGFLSTVNGSTVRPGAVTVVGTGNTPLNLVRGAPGPRDFFWDGPLPSLGTSASQITADVSPIASTDFAAQFGEIRGQAFNDTQLALLRSQIETAHAEGIMVRYWNQPAWPIGTRNACWRTLWDAGVDLLNVDDLEGAAEFWEGRG